MRADLRLPSSRAEERRPCLSPSARPGGDPPGRRGGTPAATADRGRAIAPGDPPADRRRRRLLAAGKPDEAAASLAARIEGLEAMADATPSPCWPSGFSPTGPGGAVSKLEQGRRRRGRPRRARRSARSRRAGPASAGPARCRGPGRGRPSLSRGTSPRSWWSTCGRCHVAGRKGDFQMASYQQLMRSAKVAPGWASRSELVEVILSGDMPPAEAG